MLSSYFGRLKKIFQDLDQTVSELESQASSNTLRYRKNELNQTPSDASEAIMEEVLQLRNALQQINEKLEPEISDLKNNFLPEICQQFDDLRQKMVNYETWASQYGYEPRLDKDFKDCETFVEEQFQKNKEAKIIEDQNNDDAEEDEAPNLFDFGLSKNSLQLLGYQFKNETNQEKRQEKISESTTGVEMVKDIGPTKPISALPQKFLNISEDMTSTDDDSPVSILKKPKNHQSFADCSRIELTPGLFVRPKSRSQSNSMKSKQHARIESENQNPNDGLESPKSPVLTTVNLNQLLAQSKLSSNVANGDKIAVKRNGSLESPEVPHLLYATPSRKAVSHHSLKAKTPEQQTNESFRIESPLTPSPPKLSSATLSLLKKH